LTNKSNLIGFDSIFDHLMWLFWASLRFYQRRNASDKLISQTVTRAPKCRLHPRKSPFYSGWRCETIRQQLRRRRRGWQLQAMELSDGFDRCEEAHGRAGRWVGVDGAASCMTPTPIDGSTSRA